MRVPYLALHQQFDALRSQLYSGMHCLPLLFGALLRPIPREGCCLEMLLVPAGCWSAK